MTLAAGTPIGKYVVKRKLAEGGMAEIYLCKSTGPEGFEKEVVIKRIRPFLASDPKFVEMFIKEAQLASRLNHANIVQIFDFDKHEDTYYLAMEYVHGRSLWELRKKTRELMFPLPATLVAHIGAEVARGLHAAHRLTHRGKPLGIVHRDVTPHNVLLSFDGAVKLTDFGIAKVDTTATAPGMLKGKFAYMSPEQARGEPVDARTDIFALGIVLWEMLTGGRLFDADNEIAVLRAVQQSQIAPPSRINPDVPEALSDKILKALQRDLAARYATAQELERDLKQFVIETAEHFEDTDVGGLLRKLFPEEATMVRGMSLSASALTPPTDPVPPREKTAVQSGSLPMRPVAVSAETNVLPRNSPRTERMPSVKPRAGSEDLSDTSLRAEVAAEALDSEPIVAPKLRPLPPGHPYAPAPDLGSPKTRSDRAVVKTVKEPDEDEPPPPAPEPTQIVRAELEPEAPAEPPAAAPSLAVARAAAPPPAARPPQAKGLMLAGGVFLVGIGIAVAVGIKSARSTDGIAPLTAAAALVDAGSDPRGELDPVVEERSTAEAPGDGGALPLAVANLEATATARSAPDAGSTPLALVPDAGSRAIALTAASADAGTELAVKAAVAKKKGTLRLAVAPWARVVIDGVGRGEVASPRQFSLEVGEHRLRLEHPRGNREQKVTIQAGQTTSLTVNMLAAP